MRVHFINKKYLLYKIIASSILTVTLSLNCAGQSVDPLPDSVRAMEDTVISSDVAESDSQKINTPVPDTVQLRSVPDSVIDNYKKDKNFAYANDEAYWAKEPVNRRKNFLDYFFDFLTGKVVRVFVYLLIAFVLLFAFYRIVIDNKLYLFYSPPKKLTNPEGDEEVLQRVDLDEKIQHALQSMDYRLAVRWMHLKALHLLDERGLIRFHADGTNQEYILQLSNHEQSKVFQYLTLVYDYAWYGGFALTQQQAEILQQNFNQFYTALEH
jgi:hypothetical protein